MKTFKQYLLESRWRRIDKLHPTQKLKNPDTDMGWVDYLRAHLRSGKPEHQFKAENPTFVRVTANGVKRNTKVGQDKPLWEPIKVEKDPWQWLRIKTDKEEEMQVVDGHHKYLAKKLEGHTHIKTDR